jgi:hypothetical protein
LNLQWIKTTIEFSQEEEMKQKNKGKRHPLLLYRRTMDRFVLATLPLGIVMAVIQWPGLGLLFSTPQNYDTLLLLSTIVVLGMAIVGLLFRSFAYVQARADHLRVATPLFSLKISYRRFKSVHPAAMGKLFPIHEAGWSERRFLEPYYGETAVVVELSGYPMSKKFLRLFLGPHTFLPHNTGFILMVPDWMGLSTEIDALHGKWRHMQSRAGQAHVLNTLGSK